MKDSVLKKVAEKMAQNLFENLDDCKQKEDYIKICVDGIIAGYRLREHECMDDGK